MAKRKIGSDAEILIAIREITEDQGYPPSVRELARFFGVGVQTMHNHLSRLRAEQQLRSAPGIPRSLSLTPAGMKTATEAMK